MWIGIGRGLAVAQHGLGVLMNCTTSTSLRFQPDFSPSCEQISDVRICLAGHSKGHGPRLHMLLSQGNWHLEPEDNPQSDVYFNQYYWTLPVLVVHHVSCEVEISELQGARVWKLYGNNVVAIVALLWNVAQMPKQGPRVTCPTKWLIPGFLPTHFWYVCLDYTQPHATVAFTSIIITFSKYALP